MFRRKKQKPTVTVDDHLRHIAFIMDGNGRWASKRSMPREYGHKVGAETFKKIVRYCGDIGVKIVTVYAFSTENWSRPQREVNAIIGLLDDYIADAEASNEENGIEYHFLGDRSVFAPELIEKMDYLEKLTAGQRLMLNIALNYGGRAEIVHAVNTLIADGKTRVTEEDITGALYTHHCPDPDLIIRSGHEMRLSNFLMWQSAYAELYFTDVLWPDLKPADIDRAVEDFYSRKRRFGGI